MNAVALLDRPDLNVVICGNGEVPRGLREFVGNYSFCSIRAGLSDPELANQLAAAKVFVLATRMREGRRPSGEGYGMVLQEAQLAGVPVVAPAYGGSHEVFVDGLTGVAPVDESAEALANALRDLVDDASRLAQMGKEAAEWAYERLAPDPICRTSTKSPAVSCLLATMALDYFNHFPVVLELMGGECSRHIRDGVMWAIPWRHRCPAAR